MFKPKYIRRLENIPCLSDIEKNRLEDVTDVFAFRANDYYLSLINWEDPYDPIRRIIIPDAEELDDTGVLDASCEEKYKVAPGCEHKYRDTALLLVNDVCGGFCRFCFRKRLFMNGNDEAVRDITPGVDYIRNHKEINNVLLSGGDPLILSTRKLEAVIKQIREIDHVKIIRIGTKMPAFNPFRILNDHSLLQMLSKYTLPDKKIFIMAHFNHPNELTETAVHSINLLQAAGCVIVNQTPLIKGVNDDSEILQKLFNRLSYIGVTPYYVFLCRPTMGNLAFSIPVEEACELFDRSRSRCSGLAKRAKLSMSHVNGKIEVLGTDDENIYMKYHRAFKDSNISRMLIFKRNPEAYWFDDYNESAEETVLEDAEQLILGNVLP